MSADPIFDLLARAELMRQHHETACDNTAAQEDAAGRDSPEAASALQAQDIACDLEEEARWTVLKTAPTTPAGLIAYADFMVSAEGFGENAIDERHLAEVAGVMSRFASTILAGNRVEHNRVIDKLDEVHHLLEALLMMAGSVGDLAQTNAFQRVAGLAQDALAASVAMLEGEPKPEGDAE